MITSFQTRVGLFAALIMFFVTPAVDALEYATIERGGRKYLVTGQFVARTEDKGVVIMARDGVL